VVTEPVQPPEGEPHVHSLHRRVSENAAYTVCFVEYADEGQGTSPAWNTHAPGWNGGDEEGAHTSPPLQLEGGVAAAAHARAAFAHDGAGRFVVP
jgi:hypothetical protein